MFRVALLTSTLIALAGARIYERCELARDLLTLGVDKDHIATWVCIAFHESRFDTAARNSGSGDHGLLQISELYWCGPGKACGAPCSAFRDEDISDDVKCALKIYQEHTRLQGNGFLAWVVYPHHCKTNVKKFIADCDGNTRNSSVKFEDRTSFSKTYKVNATDHLTVNNLTVKQIQPRYLSINSIFKEGYIKQLERRYNKNNNKESFNWQNFKVDNIDDLKLPDVLDHRVKPFIEFTTRPTIATTIDPQLVGIKPPSPRKIETNQFRRRKTFSEPSFLRNSFDYDYKTSERAIKSAEESSTVNILSYEDLAQNPFLTFLPNINSKSSVRLPMVQTKFTDLKEYIPPAKNENVDEISETKVLTQEDLLQNPFLRSLPGLNLNTSPEKPKAIFLNLSHNNVPTTLKHLDFAKIPSINLENDSSSRKLVLQDLSENPFLKHLTFKTNLKPSIHHVQDNKLKAFNSENENKVASTTTLEPAKTPLSFTTTEQTRNSGVALSTKNPIKSSLSRGKIHFTTDIYDRTSTQSPPTLATFLRNDDMSHRSGNFYVYRHISLNKTAATALTTGRIYDEVSTTLRPSLSNNYSRSRFGTETSTLKSLPSSNKPTSYVPLVDKQKFTVRPITFSTTTATPASVGSSPSRRFWEVTRHTQPTTSSPAVARTTPKWSQISSTTEWEKSNVLKKNVGTEATTAKTTQSIFDLYLKPMRSPIKPFNLSSFKNSVSRFAIFSGGTTKLPASYLRDV